MICESVNPDDIIPVKRCNRCKEFKEISQFQKSQCWCKSCRKEYSNKISQEPKVKIDVKKCNHCKTIKSAVKFGKDKSKKDGLSAYCKECAKKADSKRKQTKIVSHKKCSYCGQIKQTSDFYQNKRSSDGVRSRCIDCCKKQNTERDYTKMLSYNGSQRAKKTGATPFWLTKEHLDQMKNLYARASKMSVELGIAHHVDHIHPLNGRNFSGLHVPWNLQILTEAENCSKGNRPPSEEIDFFWTI